MSQQPYDTAFKSILEGREETVIPYLLPNARYLRDLDIEQFRSPLRADRVYQIEYRGTNHVLHIEIEASGESDMNVRMLEYHSILHKRFKLPVISLIIYPFQTTVVQSPYQEISGGQEILTFHFEVLTLWRMEARQYVEQKATGMYCFLPTMRGATVELLLQAIEELRETYNDRQFTDQLLWLRTLLHRAKILSVEEKQRVEEGISMFERLLDEDPYIQRIKATSEEQGKTEGRIEGKLEGKIEAKKSDILSIIKIHYPLLLKLARQKLEKINHEEQLSELHLQVYSLRDEQALRQLFNDLP